MKRFRISTLLIFTALCAGAFVMLRPFEPQVRVFDPVDLERYHGYYRNAKIYEVSVVNVGGHAIWLPDNSELYAAPTLSSLACGVKTNQVFVCFDEQSAKRVEPGEGLIYQICMFEADASFEVEVEVHDWRGMSKTIEDYVYVLGASEVSRVARVVLDA